MRTDKPIIYGIGYCDALFVHANCRDDYEMKIWYETDNRVCWNSEWYNATKFVKLHGKVNCAYCHKLIGE